MKVLMFGWEFPPKIYGGLAVASYGITKGLSLQGDMETIFCMPKPSGEEEKFLKIIGMNQVPIVWRDVHYDYLKSRLLEMTPEEYYSFRDHIYADFSYMHVNDLGCMEFAGGYPGNLHEEINNFSIIAGVVARQQEFGIFQSVGMSSRQLSQMLSFECLYYIGITLLITLTIGTIGSLMVCNILGKIGLFGEIIYHFPVLQVLLFTVVLFLVQAVFSACAVCYSRKLSLVERIKATN